MTAPERMPEHRRDRFEAHLMLARRVSQARADEQKRIADRIEQMLYETQSVEVAEALVGLARIVLDGGKP